MTSAPDDGDRITTPPIVAVLGASGFIGKHVTRRLEARGAQVRPVVTPRLVTSARALDEIEADARSPRWAPDRHHLLKQLRDVDAVVIAAGVAVATGSGDDLFGANALLPALVSAAAPATARVVHVSSAAVQGRRPVLDESTETAPFSDYSRAKALGEQAVLRGHSRAVCFRPTSVHGAGRGVTRTLARVVSSPFASVAGRGDGPTPQVLVENVADAIAFVTLTPRAVPSVVLHPHEGMSVAQLVRVLGDREPRHIPVAVARGIVSLAAIVGRRSSRAAGVGRRLEMLWFGQAQTPGWLAECWEPLSGPGEWERLRTPDDTSDQPQAGR